MIRWKILTGAAMTLLFVPAVYAIDAAGLACHNVFVQKEKCPEETCFLACPDENAGEECEQACLPKECPDIKAENCPTKSCAVMTDCTGKEICHYQMIGERPECGDLAYAGQEVPCCDGMIRRCGVEFLDGTCDMKGENSVYNLPICLPCGDGICGQFEDSCNCPEDCGGKPYTGFRFDLPENEESSKE